MQEIEVFLLAGSGLAAELRVFLSSVAFTNFACISTKGVYV